MMTVCHLLHLVLCPFWPGNQVAMSTHRRRKKSHNVHLVNCLVYKLLRRPGHKLIFINATPVSSSSLLHVACATATPDLPDSLPLSGNYFTTTHSPAPHNPHPHSHPLPTSVTCYSQRCKQSDYT